MEYKVEVEYDADIGESFIVLPESVLRRLQWEDGTLLEFDIEDGILKIFEVEE